MLLGHQDQREGGTARIPMVTADEQRALQLENAEADGRFWSSLHDMHAGTVEDRKGLAATVATKISEGEAAAARFHPAMPTHESAGAANRRSVAARDQA
jgi:hypothetical protein